MAASAGSARNTSSKRPAAAESGDGAAGPHDAASLEFTPAQMREMGEQVLERVLAHLQSLPAQPACGDTHAEALCRQLREEQAPEAGASLPSLLAPLFDEWVGRSFTTAGPGYLAFIPGGGLYAAGLADLIADTTNRFTGVWQAAPALVQLEANVLAWLADWMGFPRTARGLLTSGGSMANFAGVVCAREKVLGSELREGVLYTSEQAHHCIAKAARLAGILHDRVRLVGVDGEFRLRPDLLAAAITRDRKAGLKPFLVVSTAGTTNTGAVDPLDVIADLCARERLWHHVDGAYGAFFHMVPELRPLLAGLPRADSLALDPHKGLFLPYGTGALLVRDGADLRAAHAGHAAYLPPTPEGDEFYDPSQYSAELSRPFRGLRVWLAVKLHGAARLRAAVAEKRALAVDAAARLAAVPGLRMVAPPQLSLFAFHLSWPGASRDDENAATRELMARVVARQRVMITGCEVDGRVLARVCVLSFRTRRDRIDMAVQDIAEEAAALLGRKAGT
jgi:aromatic-L-amino-acid decarboxylase